MAFKAEKCFHGADICFRIPNIPFFYLVFRAWSHWRALSGSKHIEFLLDNKLIKSQPSPILNQLYSTGKHPFYKPVASTIQQFPSSSAQSQAGISESETIILKKSDGELIAEALKVPELEMELARAVWQVEKSLEAEKQLKEEKKKLDDAISESKAKK